MINRFLRDTVHLLIYGGLFIGLCAACITALSFELTGRAEANLSYALFIGAATAALYCAHRIIGLKKIAHLHTSIRFNVIRKYRIHILIYCMIWSSLSIWLFIPMASLQLIAWLIPGGIIAAFYVIPFLQGGRRLRDLGWGKIVMIGWSWGWLTAIIPLIYFSQSSIQLATLHGIERMLFIILLAIPFEIRDIQVDRSVGLITMPERFGRKKTKQLAILFCVLIALFSFVVSSHYFNFAYALSMSLTGLLLLPFIKYSYVTDDDLFFGGLTDGMMIIALWLFTALNLFI